MTLNKKLLTTLAVAAVSFATATMGFVGSASAACIQYDPNGFNTPTTPVFNNICGVPHIGNESDFVRIRQNVNGNDEDNQNNPNFTVGSLTSACNNGDKFDVWNYLHNDATQDANNNGAGTAVAHNVQTDLTAPLGSTNSNFTFGDTVTASNAASVHDSVALNCGGKQVKLSLVPSSVHIFSQQYTSWLNLPDSTLNTPTTIGSPTPGSGNMWGCWNYRIVTVYQVTVQVIPPTPQPSLGECKAVDLTVDNAAARQVTVIVETPDVQNAQVIGYKIDFGDNTVVNQQTASHTYTNTGQFTIIASVEIKFADNHTEWKTATGCTKIVSFTTSPTPTPPVVLTSTPPTTPTPVVLPNTGNNAATIIGIFTATTIAGAIAHRLVWGRRFGR